MTTLAEWRKWHVVQTKPITNYDRIRAMTDEELAKWMGIYACRFNPRFCKLNMSCRECWLSWFKAPVEVDDG